MTRLFIAALALTVSTLPATTAQSQETAYQMVCRKGPGLSIAITSSPRANTGITITFKRGTEKAGLGDSKMGPGECAYIDRPVYLSEPNIMFHATDVAFTATIPLDPGQEPEFETGIGFDNGSNNGRPMRDLGRFFQALNTEEYFTLSVSKKHKNYMDIVRFY